MSFWLVSLWALAGQPMQAAVLEAWTVRYNNSSNDQAAAVAVDSHGNVVVTGSSRAGLTNSTSDYYTAKYAAADGTLLWERRYDGPDHGDDSAYAVAVDDNGNVIVTGSSITENPPRHDVDFYTAKYAATNGAILWERRYNGPANRDDQATGLALDAVGNVIVIGFSSNGTNFDYYTAKYAATNGALLWETRYNSPSNHDDQATAVAVDSGGNAIVTGYSDNGTSYDYYTAKYAAANGAVIWERRYNGPANRDDQATAVAVDRSGNVLVTGYSRNPTPDSDNDFYTAKYAAADGAILWERRYNSPAGRNDQPTALAVDGNENVIVTGFSFNATPNVDEDFYTAKYAATNGAILWEKRFNGPAQSDDQATAVAVESSGNVIVTGYSNHGPPNNDLDYYTAEYAAADGTLLWEQRYNSAGNGEDYPSPTRSLALGPNGMVAVTGTSASDYLTVVYRETLPAISIDLVLAGPRLRFAATPGNYNLERALNVTGPWSTNATLISSSNGILEYIDTNAPAGSAFYRVSR